MGNCASSIQSLRLNIDTHAVSLSTSSNQGKALSGEIVDLVAQIGRKCCCEIIHSSCSLFESRYHIVDSRCSFDRSCRSSPLLYCVGRPLLNGSNYLFEGRQLRGDRGGDVLCCLFECLSCLNLTGITSRFDKCFTNCVNDIREFVCCRHFNSAKHRKSTISGLLSNATLYAHSHIEILEITVIADRIFRSMNGKIPKSAIHGTPNTSLEIADAVKIDAYFSDTRAAKVTAMPVRCNTDTRQKVWPNSTIEHLGNACLSEAWIRHDVCSN